MSILAFVEEGHTQTAFVKARPHVHEAMRVKFKLVPPIDHSAIQKANAELYQNGQTRQADRAVAKTIAERIVSWQFLDKNGIAIPGAPDATVDNILRTRGPLQDRLVLIVYHQSDGGDDDPFLSIVAPKSGAETVEDDLKN